MHKFEIVDIATGKVYETITSDDYIEGLDQANSRYIYPVSYTHLRAHETDS